MFVSLIVAWVVFTILVKIVKTTVSSAMTIAAIVVLLQISYGITPQDIWNQIVHLPQTLSQTQGSGK
ncbi:hypothetical protein PI95_020390 [Hassallia byssoidea VB512170]|uniref:Uncharacterized protein n=1 Tax=Hassallia byssoidea VB512170 TaxID=1304833 RepID=A0A846HD14_9CYAN|nr:hypothetical protein [Hassalia byssoidea]NEU74848.1 hypothetical protein [Hassalia byssoidea VB512170]